MQRVVVGQYQLLDYQFFDTVDRRQRVGVGWGIAFVPVLDVVGPIGSVNFVQEIAAGDGEIPRVDGHRIVFV